MLSPEVGHTVVAARDRSWPPVLDLTGSSQAGDPSVGDYHLLARIGRGGMAEVHLACTTFPNEPRRFAAVKLLRHDLAEEPEFTALFVREASIAARLCHPNIVRLFDVGQDPPYLAMEFIDGRSLRQLLAAATRTGGVALGLGLYIVRALADALHYAHERRDEAGRLLGLVHRDVSPANVLIGFDGSVKLADFGIAKTTARVHTTIGGSLKGKVGYMSPEQCRCDRLDRRCDVYCLGILLYEITLGRRMFAAQNEFSVFGQILRGEFQPPTALDPHYPAALERIVLQALQIEPDFRYQSAAELADALDSFMATHGLAGDRRGLADAMLQWFPPSQRWQIDRLVARCLGPGAEASWADCSAPSWPVEEIDDDATLPHFVGDEVATGGHTVVAPPPSASIARTPVSMWIAAFLGALFATGCCIAIHLILAAASDLDLQHVRTALVELFSLRL